MAPTEVSRCEFLLQRHFDCVFGGFVFVRKASSTMDAIELKPLGKILLAKKGERIRCGGKLTNGLAAICPSCWLSQFLSCVVVQCAVPCLIALRRDGRWCDIRFRKTYVN